MACVNKNGAVNEKERPEEVKKIKEGEDLQRKNSRQESCVNKNGAVNEKERPEEVKKIKEGEDLQGKNS
jgi:hypothetical protein